MSPSSKQTALNLTMIKRSLRYIDFPNQRRQRFLHHPNYILRPALGFASASNYTLDANQVTNHDDLSSRQIALYDEASSLTRALYRRCLKSVKVLAQCEWKKLFLLTYFLWI
jgi:hypothetical protein